MPYTDAFTTSFSLIARMVARKVLSNWLYWVVIDAFNIFLIGIAGWSQQLGFMVFTRYWPLWAILVGGKNGWPAAYRLHRRAGEFRKNYLPADRQAFQRTNGA